MTSHDPLVVYFSSVTENTKRFVDKMGIRAIRIPLYKKDEPLMVTEPYVLIVPTYGGGHGEGAVPKQVIRFLNEKQNRELCRAVVSSGNRNFGDYYLLSGRILQRKLQVPFIEGFELMGMPGDHERIADKIRDVFENPEKWELKNN